MSSVFPTLALEMTTYSDDYFTLPNIMTEATHWDEGGAGDRDKTIDPTSVIQKIYLAIGVLGMLDNSFVVVVLLTSRELRSSIPNMFIINQSLIDFTVSFFVIMSNYFRDMTAISSSIGRELFCRLWLTNVGIWGFYFASSYNLLCMTIERYCALVHPLKHAISISKRKMLPVLVAVWFVGVAFDMCLVTVTSYRPDPDTCHIAAKYVSDEARKVMAVFYCLLSFVGPLLVIIYCYTRIIITLRQSGRSGGSNAHHSNISKAKKNVIKTLALMCICFVLCWTWNTVYVTLYFWGVKMDLNTPFYHFTVVAVFMNCCTNPIVYAIKYNDFQYRVAYLFCKSVNKGPESHSETSSTQTTNTQI